MTNYSVIKKIEKIVRDDDIVIFFGSRLSKVVYNFDKDNYVYINNDSINLGFLIGLLYTIDKRIFVFCEDDFIIPHFNSFIEIRKYFPKNFYIFILKNKSVNNVFGSINHPQGSFFNLGFKSFKATPYFTSVENCLKLRDFIDSTKDRSTFLIEIDSDVFDKYITDIPKSYSIRKKLNNFVKENTKK